MFTDALRNFSKQFEFEPKIENADKLQPAQNFIVVGMGGSHLAADLIKTSNPFLSLTIHSDYGLPTLSREVLNKNLIIVSSYSGNTEEAIDAFNEAMNQRLNAAVIASGGELLKLAKKERAPYIEIPFGFQPRQALGYSLLAFLKLMNQEKTITELKKIVLLNNSQIEKKGKELAQNLKGFAPIIYASAKNAGLALNWKICFNETGKIPAFFNVFPELNHNEISGFDVKEPTKNLSKNFYFIFLKDNNDDLKIQRRMEILARLYQEKGLTVKIHELSGKSVWEKIISSILLAEWASYYLALNYNLDPEAVEFVEDFKKLIK